MVLDIIFIKYTHGSITFKCEFWSGTLNKCQFNVYFKSAVTFFYGEGNELLGGKGPPTISKTII